ncbi:MAG TPA: FAD-dependent oxidoreductase [Nitrospiraceae bacterium]|nr:FAD-dependent oxidoreductase [Nitrospiraceae bacterium]
MTRIIIIGGGFAGVKSARTLRKKLSPDTCEIVLFSRENSMVFYPLLAEVAAATIGPDAVTAPLRQMLPGVHCRTEEIRRIDPAASEVEYESYNGRLRRMTFDQAVIACGAAVNLTLVPGMAEHAFPLKSMGDAMSLRFHVMEQLEKAEVCDDPERRRWYLSFVVVGGGFSGVEVAGELNDLVRDSTRFYRNFAREDVTVTLIHSRGQILPEVSPSLREFARARMEQAGIQMMLDHRVELATPDGVGLADGRMIRGGTIVCTIGNTMPQLVQWLDAPKEKGRLITDPDMRLQGVSNVWAVGDCAWTINAHDNHISPATGQFAERQGHQTAKNILRALVGQPTDPFSYKPLGQLCGIGQQNAVAEILGVRLSGFPAWWLWRTIYLLKSPSWSRRVKIAFDWTWELLFPRDLAFERTNQTERISRAHYRPGDFIFLEDEPATHFYVIDRGEVEVLRRDETGRPTQVVAVLGSGEFFGEMALLDNRPRAVTVRARTAVDTLVMGKDVFSRISGSLAPFRLLLTDAMRWKRARSNPRLHRAWRVLHEEPLPTLMEAPVHRLFPLDTYEEAVRLFDEQALDSVCVVDEQDCLQGIVGKTELFNAFEQGCGPATQVQEFMLRDPATVSPDQTPLAVAELMHKQDVDWMPVVEKDDSRRLSGVIRSERMLRRLVSRMPVESTPP